MSNDASISALKRLSDKDIENLRTIRQAQKAVNDVLECKDWPTTKPQLSDLLRRAGMDARIATESNIRVGSTGDGYGTFITVAGSVINAHTAMVLLDGREVGAGNQVDHICGNRLCTDPSHLVVVTRQSNNDHQTLGRADQAVLDEVLFLFPTDTIEKIASDPRDVRAIAKSHRTNRGRPASKTQVIAIKQLKGRPILLPGGSMSYQPHQQRMDTKV